MRQPKRIIKAAGNAKPCRSASAVVQAIFAEIKARKFTQKSVAEAAGVSSVALSYWKRGIKAPNAANLEAVAGALGLEIIVQRVAKNTSINANNALTRL